VKLKRLGEDEIVFCFKVLRRNSTGGTKRKPQKLRLFLLLSWPHISGMQVTYVNVRFVRVVILLCI
jgi:hypothetical protein